MRPAWLAGPGAAEPCGSARRDLDARDWINDGRLPGPRLLTSLRSVDEKTGGPEEIRAFVRQVVADGADVIKVLATASIRDGDAPTMSYEQVEAACGEAKKLGTYFDPNNGLLFLRGADFPRQGRRSEADGGGHHRGRSDRPHSRFTQSAQSMSRRFLRALCVEGLS